MSIIEQLFSIGLSSWTALLLSLVILAHVVPYVVDPHGIRAYPGPWLASLSDLWLGKVAAEGHRSERVHKLHRKYGEFNSELRPCTACTFVRIAPNHLSIASPEAIQVVYGHGTGTLKSDFYDAFVSIEPGLFNTRSRPDHSRKRKIVSHIFSPKSVLEFEPHVRDLLEQLFKQWDRLSTEGGVKGLTGTEGEGGWKGRDGRVWFDCLPWYNYLAFDIIGDLAFGAPFGMLVACKDSAPVAVSAKDAMASYGKGVYAIEHFPAVQVLNERGEYSASIGVLPPFSRQLVKILPWYNKGNKAVQRLAGIAIAAVAHRLASPSSDRRDLLAKLQEGRDDHGNPMGRSELTAEALTLLIAGSDTTSNSSCAITYYLAKHQRVQEKLQQELDDEVVGVDDPIVDFEQVKHLPYLEAVINETLRIHSTSAIGLPRVVPAGGLEVCGKWFPEGTVLSVPSYTIHRDRSVWGEDADEYRPERWFEQDKNAIHKAFNPFSFGPRSCVGRNLATMELFVFIASVFRRYHFVLQDPDASLETIEGALRKPVKCIVGMKRRDI